MFWASCPIICIFRLTLNGLINKSQGGSWKGNLILLNSSFYIYWKGMPLNAFLWMQSIFQSSWGLGMFFSGSFQLLHTTKQFRTCLLSLHKSLNEDLKRVGEERQWKGNWILTYSCSLPGWKASAHPQNFHRELERGRETRSYCLHRAVHKCHIMGSESHDGWILKKNIPRDSIGCESRPQTWLILFSPGETWTSTI